MNGKEFVIEKLEEALKKQEEVIEREIQSIKNMNNDIDETGKEIATARSQIKGLKDAIHKLKGLDNLEKKNKIADSAEMAEHQILRKGPTRTQLKWKDVEDMEIRRFIKDYLLPEITQLLRDRQYTFHEQLKEALK
ncbi:MAG: hypothetical protein NWE89_13660 [Candidatus Bathyarchaeota archaeon]|nr:hypothetical protein [Candidatus Bathyarchaeota archaeon]